MCLRVSSITGIHRAGRVDREEFLLLLQHSFTKYPCFLLAFSPHYKASWRWQRRPTPVLLPGESHGQRSLVGYSPRGHKESDTTEQLHFHFSLPCVGEGAGNSLQYSCLENPRDRRAWWAIVYGVVHSQTRLKRLSSSRKHPVRPVSAHFAMQIVLLSFLRCQYRTAFFDMLSVTCIYHHSRFQKVSCCFIFHCFFDTYKFMNL